MYFQYFVIISPCKRAGPFIWTNLNPLHPRMHCANFGWNWLSGSGEWDFLISSIYFRYFVIISPWKRAGPSFEQTWILYTQGCFVPRLVATGSVVLDKKIFLILSIYFRYFVIISPCKRAGPFIWTNLNPLHLRMLCAKFGWNWPSGSGEEDENVKSLQTDRQTDRRTDRQTDDGQKVIRKALLSFQLRWAKNVLAI